MDIMLIDDELSQASISHACELGWKARSVLPYGLFLAADVEFLSLLLWVCLGLFTVVLVRTVEILGSPSPPYVGVSGAWEHCQQVSALGTQKRVR